MSGAVASLVGSVMAAAAAPTNLVLNGSATTTDTTGWSDGNRTTSTFKSAPACWESVFNPDAELYLLRFNKSNTLTVGSKYSLSFWAKSNIVQQDINVYFGCGNSNSFLTASPTTAAFSYYKIENITCTSNQTLSVYFDNALCFVDDVAVIAGATAL